jgi:hypothetical protein
MTGGSEPAPDREHVIAVQLRSDGDLLARLFSGAPSATVSAARGDIVLLPAGQLVAYVFERRRTIAVYIFRTCGDGALTFVPGVSEPVRLLFSSRRRGAFKRARNFILNLTKYGHDPSDLSDDFWVRAGAAFTARRRPARQLLSYLLARETAGEAARLRDRRVDPGDLRQRGRRVPSHTQLHPQHSARSVLVAAGTSHRARRDR